MCIYFLIMNDVINGSVLEQDGTFRVVCAKSGANIVYSNTILARDKQASDRKEVFTIQIPWHGTDFVDLDGNEVTPVGQEYHTMTSIVEIAKVFTLSIGDYVVFHDNLIDLKDGMSLSDVNHNYYAITNINHITNGTRALKRWLLTCQST